MIGPGQLDRRRRIAIARVGARLYAFDDLCTCSDQACPLSGGLLIGTTIMCQCHGSRFDITTGAVINGPATAALNVYSVQEEEGTFESEFDIVHVKGFANVPLRFPVDRVTAE